MPIGMPPRVPGVTQNPVPPQDPMEMLGRVMSARPEQGMQLFKQGLDTLKQAAAADPRLEPVVASIMKVAIQGPPGGNGEKMGRGGSSEIGPAPGSIISTRSPV